METVKRAKYPDNICEGCLTRDRILAIITNDEIREVYCSIITEKLNAPGPLVLCWECIANIQRFISFKRQCANAHDILVNMHFSSNIKCLSKLSIVKNNVEINITHQDSPNTDDKLKYQDPCESQNIGLQFTHKYEQNYDFEEPQSNENNLNTCEDFPQQIFSSGGVPLTPESKEERHLTLQRPEGDITFVKIEENEADDEYYIGDENNHQSEIDDKNIDAVPNKIKKNKVISKRSKKKKIHDDFDDSDEEPLKNKRKKTVRKRKEKKEIDGNSKEADFKLPTRRREKPPGVVTSARVKRKLQQLNVAHGQLEMVVLSWDEVEEERQKALQSEVFTRHEYRCSDCIVGFNHKFKLDNHMKKHDPSSGDMICNICKIRCKKWHSLSAHKRRHRVRWRCVLCGGTWSRAGVAADHASRTHGVPTPTHTCTICGHQETTLGKLRNHLKNHGERQKCELCGKTFRDRTSLRTHLFIHKGEKEYSCPRCEKKFLFKKAMEIHLVTHDASAHLYCYQCDMNFKNRMSFTQHMKYSLKHIDPAKLKYACQLCDKKFLKATRLEEHNLAIHLKATPIQCTITGCNFACSSRPVLRTHIRMVHRNVKAQRNHVCDTCGKTYATKKTLEGHIRSHTGERPFKCDLCPSTFGYEAALYNHNKLVHLKVKACSSRPVLRTHIRMVHRNVKAQRNHVCDTCGKTYATKKTLEGHIRSHTGERPFKCDLCPSTFGYEAALYNHNKLVHLKVKINRRSVQPSVNLEIPGPNADLS